MSREQIGTVRITRLRVYTLDPMTADDPLASTVLVEPGEYPVYRDGLSHYWKMTGVLNHGRMHREGDGIFTMTAADQRSEDDVVFYSRRYGPDEWQDLLAEFSGPGARLVFSVQVEEPTP